MNRWRAFWNAHAQESRTAPPQVQVLRTWQKQPVSEEVFQAIVRWIVETLDLQRDHQCLDLCCGNGLITRPMAACCQSVMAVDFSSDLLHQVVTTETTNITTQLADICHCEFSEASFDRILLYAGIQYLNERQTIGVMRSLRNWLRPGGRILIGDIPDRRRMWDFFDTPERREEYFDRELNDKPAIGTWYDPKWLSHLATSCGFVHTIVVEQPEHLPFRHFRFDLVLA